MGTSQSNPGLGNNSPLVPPWADDPSDKPAQVGDFRQAMRTVAQGGGRHSLEKALGHYAREVTGGSRFATRRLGNAIQGGADLYGALSGIETNLIDINLLVGKSCDEVLGIMSQALSKNHGDADSVHVATTQALSEALEGKGIFSTDLVTQDVITSAMVNYHTEIIANHIMQSSGNSWNKATEPGQIIAAENSLRQLVHVVVDKYMTPKLQTSNRSLSRTDIIQIEKAVIQEVWTDWEAYQ